MGLRFEFKPPGAYKRNVLILHGMCWTRLFTYKPPPLYLNSEYTCTIDDFQGFTYSVSPYKVMYMAIYGHITKFNEGNACLSRHSSSPRSVSGLFISPRGWRFENRARGLINELQFIFLNSSKGHFFVYKPRAYILVNTVYVSALLNVLIKSWFKLCTVLYETTPTRDHLPYYKTTSKYPKL